MKKIILCTALLCASMLSFGAYDASDYTDAFDAKLTCKQQVINNGTAVYKSVTYKGTLYIVYENGEAVGGSARLVGNNHTKECSVEILHKSVIGKKLESPNMVCRIYDDDGTIDITCAGKGSFKKIKSDGCCMCGDCGGDCYKPSFEGNLVGLTDCLCGVNSYGRELEECGASDETINSQAACFGSFKFKWNKKLSK